MQDFQGLIQANGHEPMSFDHNDCVSTVFKDVDGPVTVTSQGTGSLYLTITAEGQACAEVVPYAHGLNVARRWIDQDGNDIDVAQLAELVAPNDGL